MNKNWFFDNVNFAARQKVWATKVPRFGEIIWFFPFGDSTECNKAIVFNINEKTWYDFELSRTAGYYSQVFQYPIWAGDSSNFATRLELDGVSGTFLEGSVVVGTTSGTRALVLQVETGNTLIIQNLSSPSERVSTFEINEVIKNSEDTASGAISLEVPICSNYVHEKGFNKVTATSEEALPSYFETSDFGYPTGGAQQNDIRGLNRWTRLIRIEPDFMQSGDMDVEVIGREFAQQPDTVSAPFTFTPDTGKIDMREQRRQIRLRFTSNVLNGNYEMGRVILHTEPGDVRS